MMTTALPPCEHAPDVAGLKAAQDRVTALLIEVTNTLYVAENGSIGPDQWPGRLANLGLGAQQVADDLADLAERAR